MHDLPGSGRMARVQPIRLDDARLLRPFQTADAGELHALIAANREHLAPWMPWARQGRAETVGFLVAAEQRAARDDGVQFAILEAGRIVGSVGFHAVQRANGSTSIGYWLAADAQGRGTITLAVAALLDLAFDTWELHRVEIRVAAGNARSLAVARRLGFVEEGVLREAEKVGDRHLDLLVHSLLRREWQGYDR